MGLPVVFYGPNKLERKKKKKKEKKEEAKLQIISSKIDCFQSC